MKINHILRIFITTTLFFFAVSTAMADDDKISLPADYYDRVQELFGDEQWQSGKKLLDEGLTRYPDESNLHTLAGRYWMREENYDRARYHLVKAVNEEYNNVEAKQMLVTVEEITGNYSSAICYINELLEVNPYWEGLWRRKIELYKRQGNTYEATRLFKRLQQIYPHNQGIKDAYFYDVELQYAKLRKEGRLLESGDALRELVRLNPKNVDYQLALINHYYNAHQIDKAINHAGVALAENPGNVQILRKKVSILEENGQHDLALSRVQAFITKHRSPEAIRLYNELLLEDARHKRKSDPYVIYANIFERNKNDREALDFLLNTAIRNGYENDAFYYIKEAKRIYGNDDKKVRYKEYELYNSLRMEKKAINILTELHKDFPDDYDIAYALCARKLKLSEDYISDGLHNEAIPELKAVTEINVDEEMNEWALRRLFTCYIVTEKWARHARRPAQ